MIKICKHIDCLIQFSKNSAKTKLRSYTINMSYKCYSFNMLVCSSAMVCTFISMVSKWLNRKTILELVRNFGTQERTQRAPANWKLVRTSANLESLMDI